MQSPPILSQQVRHPPGAFWGMNVGPIHDHDDPPFAARRAGHALFDQLTEGFRIAFLGADAHDLAGTPVRGRTLLSFGRAYPRSPDFALLTPQHPHPRERGEQAQFGFVLDVEIGPARRVV
ncbi:MAG: hypothetical protein M1570_18070 [Chloroflexi bacterium]|nr:hypothetical protein [Chloroflexota bacterium]